MSNIIRFSRFDLYCGTEFFIFFLGLYIYSHIPTGGRRLSRGDARVFSEALLLPARVVGRLVVEQPNSGLFLRDLVCPVRANLLSLYSLKHPGSDALVRIGLSQDGRASRNLSPPRRRVFNWVLMSAGRNVPRAHRDTTPHGISGFLCAIAHQRSTKSPAGAAMPAERTRTARPRGIRTSRRRAASRTRIATDPSGRT